MATRDTYSSSSGTFSGGDFADNIAAHFKRIYDAAGFPLSSVAGTANAVTAVVDPGFDSGGLVDGMKFTIIWGAPNTGGVTLALNGLSAAPVIDGSGAALVSGALAAGLLSQIEYRGGSFRILGATLQGSAGGSGSYYFQITTSQTWMKPAGLDDDRLVFVEVWSAGGGGASIGTGTGGAGGGGGGYAFRLFRAADLPASISIAIGAGGAGAASGAGSDGGNTTFGALISVYGATGAGASTPGVGGGEFPPGTLYAEAADKGGLGGDGGPGQNAVRGAGGGGAKDKAGGVSRLAGNGGAGSSSAPVAGSAPGGGGGGTTTGVTAGSGARGEVRIWI